MRGETRQEARRRLGRHRHGYVWPGGVFPSNIYPNNTHTALVHNMSEAEGGSASSVSGDRGEPTNSTAAAGTLSSQPPAPRVVVEATALLTDKQDAPAIPAGKKGGKEDTDVTVIGGAPAPEEQEGQEPESSATGGVASASARPNRRAAIQARSQIFKSYDKHIVADNNVNDEEVVTLPPVAITARRRGSSSAAATSAPRGSSTTATVRKKDRQTPRMPVSGRPKVGTQIAKIFPGWGLYLGQVVEIKEGTYWVRYEDGEEEGFKREGIELLQTLLLYSEAEITTQVRNSRLRLREVGLMTEEEVSRAEREDEAREEERRVEAEEEGEEGEEEGGAKEEEEVEEKGLTASSAAPGRRGRKKGKKQQAKKKKKHEEVVEVDGEDKVEEEVAEDEVEEGEDEKPIILHCEQCWCTFISEGGLVYHKNKDVCRHYKRKDTRNPTPEEMEGGEGEREGLKCPVCEKTFEWPNCLKYHLERAVGCVGGGREGGKKEEVEAVLLSLARPKESRTPQAREGGRKKGEEASGGEDDGEWGGRGKGNKKAAALRKLMTTMVGDVMEEEEEEEEEGGVGGVRRRRGMFRRRSAIEGIKKGAKLAQMEAKKKEKGARRAKKRRREGEDGEEEGSECSVGDEESEEEQDGDEEGEDEEEQEEEEDEEGSVSVLGGGGKRRGGRVGGRGVWEGKRQMVGRGTKSRVVDSRVTVALPGVEGMVDTGFDRGMLVVGEVEEGLKTDLKGLQLLLHHHHHEQQQVEDEEGGRAEEKEEGQRRVYEVVDLSAWMLENGLEVASLPLRLVHKTRGPAPPPVLVEILPFHSLSSPFSFPSSSSSSNASCSRSSSDKEGRKAEGGEAETDLLANAGGPVQCLDILSPPHRPPPPPPPPPLPFTSPSAPAA